MAVFCPILIYDSCNTYLFVLSWPQFTNRSKEIIVPNIDFTINIAIFSDCYLAYEGLINVLSRESGFSVMEKSASFSMLLHDSQIKPDVILICPRTIFNMTIDKLNLICKKHPEVKFIAINVGHEEEQVIMGLIRIGLRGIIYRNDSPSTYTKAIRMVHEDDLWIRRNVMLKFIKDGSKNTTPAGERKDNLTAREQEILELIAKGNSNKAIAKRLYISEHTVKFHIQSIFKKLNVGNRVEAALSMSVQSVCMPISNA